jgi:hypothetical protein
MDDDRNIPKRPGGGRVWAGLFLLLVGGVLLLDQMGFPLPDWLFSWHVLLVAIGIFLGLRHNFRGGAWFILIVIGGIYLIQDYNPDVNLHRFIWPGILIILGMVFILRPRHHWHDEWKDKWRDEMKYKWRQHKWQHRNWSHTAPQDPVNPVTPGDPGQSFGSSTGPTSSSEDYIDTTSVFGGVHKKVVSKNFKGGDVTTFLGGTEIDLTQADINGVVRLDVTLVMGGTKIIVPAHWEVRSQVTAVFAGFEDKRQQPVVTNPDKVLILEGTSIFGGIELKNY